MKSKKEESPQKNNKNRGFIAHIANTKSSLFITILS